MAFPLYRPTPLLINIVSVPHQAQKSPLTLHQEAQKSAIGLKPAAVKDSLILLLIIRRGSVHVPCTLISNTFLVK